MNKGISYILSVILMLIIVVAIAGIAWLYISGYFWGVGISVDVLDFNYGELRVKNLGTRTLTVDSIEILVEHEEVPISIVNDEIGAGETGTIIILNSYDYNGKKNVKIGKITFLGDFGKNWPEGQSSWLVRVGAIS